MSRCYLFMAWALCWCNYQVSGERPGFHGEDYEYDIKLIDGSEFLLRCLGKQTLDNALRPRYAEVRRVRAATLADCPPPERSYARALSAHNVLVLDRLTIDGATRELTGAHLAGLNVSTLVLENLRIAPDAFDAFNGTTLLTHLWLQSVGTVHVDRLPASLRYLHLTFTDVSDLTPARLRRLSNLTVLMMEENGNISVEAAAPLQEVALNGDFVRVHPALPDKLAKLTVRGWAEPAPRRWQTCEALRELVVVGGTMVALPSDWLASCGRLRQLELRECGLATLPMGLLDKAVLLSQLDLSRNRLQTLPSGLFAKTCEVSKLNLSNNELVNGVFDMLSAVTSLQELSLANNAALGDACPGSVSVPDMSRLKDLMKLQKLDLSHTAATTICPDFLQEMLHLKELNLSHNNITTLTGNNVTRLIYKWPEYLRLTANKELYCDPNAAEASRAHFNLTTSALNCDCDLVPAALALRECPAHVRLSPLYCKSGRALADVPADELVCERECPAAAAAPHCACARRERAASGTRELERLLRVTCRAGPAPALRANDLTQMILANNGITALARSDLPPHLLDLDLRNNSLRRLDPSIVAALPADGRLWLGGNDLSCDCEDADAVAALLGRSDRVQDFEELRCPGGGPLRPPTCERLGPLSTLAAALVPLLAVAALLLGCLARRESRARLKMALRRLGWLPPPAEPDDDGRPYDAFVSFSHLDEDVVRELLAQLEGGARPYRVCVHYRDWAPGGWIPAQIAASVRRSRRTLAVVSERFLASTWARAEFREAHAAALRDPEQRLVVVLLDEPARLPLDDELRRYLAANTYVRWGDPWFWPKLRAALPPPRGRAAPPPAPADPAHPVETTHPNSVAEPASEPLMLSIPNR